jgi:hypothetical protein
VLESGLLRARGWIRSEAGHPIPRRDRGGGGRDGDEGDGHEEQRRDDPRVKCP